MHPRLAAGPQIALAESFDVTIITCIILNSALHSDRGKLEPFDPGITMSSRITLGGGGVGTLVL